MKTFRPFLFIQLFVGVFLQSFYAQDNAPDLSGTWEGMAVLPYMSAYVEYFMVKIGPNQYSGIRYLSWRKNEQKDIPYKDPRLHNVNKVFAASFDGQHLQVNDIDTIRVKNMPGAGSIGKDEYYFANNNGTPELDVKDDKGAMKTFLKQVSADIPAEYAQHEISRSTLQISSSVFYPSPSSPPGTQVKYSKTGHFLFNLTNNSNLNLKDIQLKISLQDPVKGLFLDNNNGTFGIAKNGQKSVNANISTNFSLQGGDIHFVVTALFHGICLAQKDIVMTAEPFFKTEQVAAPSYTSARIKAVASYYGFEGLPYANVAPQLDAIVASGDKLAAVWKGMFTYMGYAGYATNEDKGLNLIKTNLKALEEEASNGSAEGLFLMHFACRVGAEGAIGPNVPNDFLRRAADAGFKPALYDEGLQLYLTKDYTNSYKWLQQSFDNGVKKATVVIGRMYEKGFSVNKDIEQAKAWYQKGIAFGDPDAMLKYAIFSSQGEDVAPDMAKAQEWATKAAAKTNTGAMVFMGNVYSQGNQGIPMNIALAIKWFKQAADLGDRQGMVALASIYLSDNLPGVVKDDRSCYFWAKKASELGEPTAMKILYKLYNEGIGIEKDIIRARYWHNQAALRGTVSTDYVNAQADDIMNFWKYADFSPTYSIVSDGWGGASIVNNGPDIFGGIISGWFGAYMDRQMNVQDQINGLELIQEKNGKKIYGGTVSTYFVSNLILKQGQTATIKAYGVISTGMMSGNANADGLGTAWAEYRIVPDIPCSAVMAGIKDSNWKFIGQSNNFTAPTDGPLAIALNGKDSRSYKGYFDLVVEVAEN